MRENDTSNADTQRYAQKLLIIVKLPEVIRFTHVAAPAEVWVFLGMPVSQLLLKQSVHVVSQQ